MTVLIRQVLAWVCTVYNDVTRALDWGLAMCSCAAVSPRPDAPALTNVVCAAVVWSVGTVCAV